MTAVLVRARAELQARWRVWLSLTLMVGNFGVVDLSDVEALPQVAESSRPRIFDTISIAFLPGRGAGRVQAASVLRTE
jgi:hypothetical protein